MADAIAALLALEPKTAADYLTRGNARSDRKDYDGAIADYDQAIRLDPKHATAYYNRGIARKAKGNLRPPDLWDSVVEPSSGFRLRRRSSTRVAAWCRDR